MLDSALELLGGLFFDRPGNTSYHAAKWAVILEIDKTSHPEIIADYARALAAADNKNALEEFRQWAENIKGEKPVEIGMAAAGLALLAGDPEPARKLEVELRQSGDGQAPMRIGELGWWHYRDGNYQKAVELLSEASQQRPSDTELGLQLAWAQIEIRRYGDALQIVQNTGYAAGIEPEKAMVRAVSRWQAQERDQALRDFTVALGGQPEWENSIWVKALYSPLVGQTIQEMKSERERRKQRARAAAGRRA